MASQARPAPCRDCDVGSDTQGCAEPFFEVKGDPVEVRLPCDWPLGSIALSTISSATGRPGRSFLFLSGCLSGT